MLKVLCFFLRLLLQGFFFQLYWRDTLCLVSFYDIILLVVTGVAMPPRPPNNGTVVSENTWW